MVLASAGWWLGRRYAAIAAVLAAISWFTADLARRPSSEARFAGWGGVTRLCLFVFIGVATGILRSNQRRLRRSRRSLEEEIERARTDVVSKLLNPRGFVERLEHELAAPARTGEPWALAAIEIQGLRRYRTDHEVSAEEVLVRRVAAVLRRSIRASDTAARLGEEQFAVSFHDVEKETVEKTLRRVISGIAALAVEDPDARLSTAIGVAFFTAPPDDPKEAFRQAEKALQIARETGSGALFVHEQETPAAAPLAVSPARG